MSLEILRQRFPCMKNELGYRHRYSLDTNMKVAYWYQYPSLDKSWTYQVQDLISVKLNYLDIMFDKKRKKNPY